MRHAFVTLHMDLKHSDPMSWGYWGSDFVDGATNVREGESFVNTWSREAMAPLGLQFPCSRKPLSTPIPVLTGPLQQRESLLTGGMKGDVNKEPFVTM